MNAPANPTPAQMQRAMQAGVLTTLYANGVPEKRANTIVARYPSLKKAQATRAARIAAAILGKPSTAIPLPQ